MDSARANPVINGDLISTSSSGMKVSRVSLFFVVRNGLIIALFQDSVMKQGFISNREVGDRVMQGSEDPGVTNTSHSQDVSYFSLINP